MTIMTENTLRVPDSLPDRLRRVANEIISIAEIAVESCRVVIRSDTAQLGMKPTDDWRYHAYPFDTQ